MCALDFCIGYIQRMDGYHVCCCGLPKQGDSSLFVSAALFHQTMLCIPFKSI